MKTILCLVDFSDDSRNAMDYAILLAGKLKMNILMMHVFDPSLKEAITDTYKLMVNETITGTPREVKTELDMWKDALVAAQPDIPCEAVFEEGNLLTHVRQLMKTRKIDLIVMGTKGASGVKEVFAGSNTMKIIGEALCPVFAVPSGFSPPKLEHVAFATNYKLGDDLSIRFMGNLAKTFSADMQVVHVISDDMNPGDDECLSSNFVQGIAREIQYDKLSFNCLKGSDTFEVLERFVADNHIDLLAISFTHRSFLTTFFRHGVARKVTHHLRIPFIVFQKMEEEDNVSTLTTYID